MDQRRAGARRTMTDHDPRLVNLARTFLASIFADGRELQIVDLASILGIVSPMRGERSPFGLALTSLLADGSLKMNDGRYRAACARRPANLQPSRTFLPTSEQAHRDPLLAAAFHMGLDEAQVIELQADRIDGAMTYLMKLALSSTTVLGSGG